MLLELKTYTDDELIEALEIAPSTLKSKRKVTEERLLKDYEWSRDKKKKLYTIHAYKGQDAMSSLFTTFESMVYEFSPNAAEVPLKNIEKALRILVALYYMDENLPSTIALAVDEKPREVSRYVNKFKELDILVKNQYDYYLVDEDNFEWEQIDDIQYRNIMTFWKDEFYSNIDKFRVRTDTPKSKVKFCMDRAWHKVVDEYGFIRKVSKKDLTEEAKEYFGPFLRYSNEQLEMMFRDSIPAID